MKCFSQIGFAVLIAIVSYVPASHASAQQQPRGRVQSPQDNEIPVGLRFADIKLGPLYLQPRVGLKDIGYDTNVLGTPEAVAVADTRVTPSAGTRLVIPIRQTHTVSGDAEVEYTWFAETRELRTFNGYFDARYQHDSDRWNADLYTRYINAQRGQLDIVTIGDETVPPSYEIFGTIRQRSLDVGLRLGANVGSRLVIEPRVLRRIIRFEDDTEAGIVLSESLDRTEESVGGAIGWRLTSRTTVGIDGGYQFNDYESPDNPREADLYLVAGRLDLDDRGPLYGTFVGGYRRLRPTDDKFTGYAGFAFDAGFSFAPRGIAEITLLGDRDVYPSFWLGNVYFLRQGGGTTVLFQAQRSLAFGVELTYYEHQYPIEATFTQADGSTITAQRLDKLSRAFGRVEWRYGDSGRVIFRVGWVERKSNFDIANSSGVVASGGYSMTF